jgi:hypothetical protein
MPGVAARRSALDELKRRQQSGYVPSAAFVNAYLGLGDNERAFAWLERAYTEHSMILQFIKVHPFFDPLRGDPLLRTWCAASDLTSLISLRVSQSSSGRAGQRTSLCASF